jgi:WD40 repeat protein
LSHAISRSTALGQIWCLQFSPSGRYLAAGGKGGAAIWRRRTTAQGLTLDLFRSVTRSAPARTGKPQTSPAESTMVYDLTFHPGETDLVLLSDDSRLHVAPVNQTGKGRALNGRAQTGLRHLQFDASGERLTFITAEHTLGVLDWQSGAVRDTGHKVFHVALAADGVRAAASSPDHEVTVYDLPSGREVLKLPAEGSDIWGLTWSRDGARLAVGLSDGCVAVWDLQQVRARLSEFQIDLYSTSR